MNYMEKCATEKEEKAERDLSCSAGTASRGRTGTPITGQKILSLSCLPIPTSRQTEKSVLINLYDEKSGAKVQQKLHIRKFFCIFSARNSSFVHQRLA